MSLVVENEKTMKQRFYEMERKLQEKEKELQDKEKELELRIIPPIVESNEHNIVQALSQVSLKDLQLSGLKNQNKNMENLRLQREQERKTWEAKSQAWEAKRQELQTKNDKLMKQVTGQAIMQGAKHLIWDAIITEPYNFRPYLDYILDKEVVIHSSRKIMAVAREN